MIEDAERRGRLKPGATIVEPTSGNTGIGLAIAAAVKGYRLILTMPDDMSVERRRLLERFGAELRLTPAIEGMTGAVFAATQLLEEYPDAFMPQQFENPANPEIHRRTTAREILEAIEGPIDAFVVGVGTGGTLTGVGEVLKKERPGVRVVAVEPARSPVLSGGKAAAPHPGHRRFLRAGDPEPRHHRPDHPGPRRGCPGLVAAPGAGGRACSSASRPGRRRGRPVRWPGSWAPRGSW